LIVEVAGATKKKDYCTVMGACPGGNPQCNQYCVKAGFTKGGLCGDEKGYCCCTG